MRVCREDAQAKKHKGTQMLLGIGFGSTKVRLQ
jgi:hypothetical protein